MSDMLPPEHVESPSVPPAPTPPMSPAAPPTRQPVLVGFLVLGLVLPCALNVIPALLGSALSSLDPSGVVLPVIGGFTAFLPPLTVVAVIVAFFLGRSRGDNRLRSFGLGGLISIAVGALLLLLAFGTCLVGLANFPS